MFKVLLLTTGAVALPLFFSPFTPYDPFLIPKEVLLSSLACLALVFVFLPLETLLHKSNSAIFLAILFFLGCISISLPQGINYHIGLMELKRWVYLLILFFTASQINWNVNRLRKFMVISVIAGGIVGVSVILEYLEIITFFSSPLRADHPTLGYRLFSFFGYQNITAQYLIIILMWCIGLTLMKSNVMERTGAWICTMIIGTALLLTFCRGAIVSAALGIAILFFIKKNKINIETNYYRKKRFLLFACCIIIVSTSIYIFINKPTSLATNHFADKIIKQLYYIIERGDNERFIRWKDTFNMIRFNPVNGVGLGNYSNIYPLFKTGNWTNITIYAHNEYLHMLAETGLIGLLGFGGFLIFAFIRSIKKITGAQREDEKILLITILLGCIVTMIHSNFSYNFHSAASSYFFFIGLGVLCSRESSVKDESLFSKSYLIANIIVFVFAVGISIWGLSSEYHKFTDIYKK